MYAILCAYSYIFDATDLLQFIAYAYIVYKYVRI